ncbi:cysteine desulfurase [Candidatus Woesearchaeota archaeon]|nr:cysteine desulfurase [Candidatus Woesearchaeota archaeon]
MERNIERIRKDFPVLKRKVHGKPLVYLDNAATTQKPRIVIKAMNDYYEQFNANIHRGIHTLSEEATLAYEESHKKTADFINASSDEIIFTKNTTESINLLAYSLAQQLKKGDEILITEMEHHSNFVPWQQMALKYGFKLNFIPVKKDGMLDMNHASHFFSKKTKIVSVSHVSNALGTINDVRQITKMAHEVGALSIIDAAQSVPHMPVDVKKINGDFLVFSSHKMCGPTGIGILYGRRFLLDTMEPFLFGGDMIRQVTKEKTTWNDLPWKFEAGTPNIAGAIGHSAGLKYLQKIGLEKIRKHEVSLTKYAHEQLGKLKGITIYGVPEGEGKGGIVSFNLDNIHPHDVATILDTEGIAIRAGNHCAMPLMKVLGIQGTSRASFYVYNTFEEIDKLVAGLQKASKIFG